MAAAVGAPLPVPSSSSGFGLAAAKSELALKDVQPATRAATAVSVTAASVIFNRKRELRDDDKRKTASERGSEENLRP